MANLLRVNGIKYVVGKITIPELPPVDVEYENGVECVDFGDAGKWATRNIGATSPEKNGLYFAFGETVGYATASAKSGGFYWNTTKYIQTVNGFNSTWTKYVTSDRYGTVDGRYQLETEDDPAYVNLGTKWRTPSKIDWQLLCDSCKIEYIENYNDTGVQGFLFTLKTNKRKRIFFPYTTYAEQTQIRDLNLCYVLLKDQANPYNTVGRVQKYNDEIWTQTSAYYRYNGHPVRGFVPSETQSIVEVTITLLFNIATSYIEVTIDGTTSKYTSAITIKVPKGTTITKWVAYGFDGYTLSPYTGTSIIVTSDMSIGPTSYSRNSFDTGQYLDLYVDLGPAGVWATCNLGAFDETDYGEYFQWADIKGYEDACSLEESYTSTTKHYFSPETAKHVENMKFIKYNDEDRLNVMQLEDDAAYMVYGGQWRVPTFEDWDRLNSYCRFEYRENYNNSGVNGALFTLRTDSSKKIFFPYGGYGRTNNIINKDRLVSGISLGYYAVRQLQTYGFCYEIVLADGGLTTSRSDRVSGENIRPIIDFSVTPNYNLVDPDNLELKVLFNEGTNSVTVSTTGTPAIHTPYNEETTLIKRRGSTFTWTASAKANYEISPTSGSVIMYKNMVIGPTQFSKTDSQEYTLITAWNTYIESVTLSIRRASTGATATWVYDSSYTGAQSVSCYDGDFVMYTPKAKDGYKVSNSMDDISFTVPTGFSATTKSRRVSFAANRDIQMGTTYTLFTKWDEGIKNITLEITRISTGVKVSWEYGSSSTRQESVSCYEGDSVNYSQIEPKDGYTVSPILVTNRTFTVPTGFSTIDKSRTVSFTSTKNSTPTPTTYYNLTIVIADNHYTENGLYLANYRINDGDPQYEDNTFRYAKGTSIHLSAVLRPEYAQDYEVFFSDNDFILNSDTIIGINMRPKTVQLVILHVNINGQIYWSLHVDNELYWSGLGTQKFYLPYGSLITLLWDRYGNEDFISDGIDPNNFYLFEETEIDLNTR